MTKISNSLKKVVSYVQPLKKSPFSLNLTYVSRETNHNPVTVHKGSLQTDWHALPTERCHTDMGHSRRHGDSWRLSVVKKEIF
jgi:hypothetical protein